MSRSVAVVGSGPGGMYVVQGLLKLVPDVKIDVIERLPSPFGLIRGGVAPDHATTKNVSRAFEKAMTHANVRYLGNIEVGRDVSVAELEEIYDAVVLAYGAPYDNQLGIPGEDKKNVFGSNAFVGWYNCHPDFRELNPNLEIDTVAVIGAGNVAIDVARVLAKTPAEMAHTDLADHAAEVIHPSPIKHVWMFARRGPVEGAFTNVELREMGELVNCAPVIEHPEQIPETPDLSHLEDRDARLKAKNVETLRSFIGAPTEGKAKRLHFEFYASPVEILGGDTVEGIRLEKMRALGGGRVERTGETFDVPCQMVVTCIGSRAARLGGVPFDDKKGIVLNEAGKVRDRLYAAGWVKRGASGTIGTNKTDSDAVVARVIEEFAGDERPGRAALDKLLATRGEVVRALDYADWQTIDKAEMAAATKPAPRRKFVCVDDMLAALDQSRAAQ